MKKLQLAWTLVSVLLSTPKLLSFSKQADWNLCLVILMPKDPWLSAQDKRMCAEKIERTQWRQRKDVIGQHQPMNTLHQSQVSILAPISYHGDRVNMWDYLPIKMCIVQAFQNNSTFGSLWDFIFHTICPIPIISAFNSTLHIVKHQLYCHTQYIY